MTWLQNSEIHSSYSYPAQDQASQTLVYTNGGDAL